MPYHDHTQKYIPGGGSNHHYYNSMIFVYTHSTYKYVNYESQNIINNIMQLRVYSKLYCNYFFFAHIYRPYVRIDLFCIKLS